MTKSFLPAAVVISVDSALLDVSGRRDLLRLDPRKACCKPRALVETVQAAVATIKIEATKGVLGRPVALDCLLVGAIGMQKFDAILC
mmetsp:Transcript_11300/g.25977  ORF Transcript_11300/g.25977 Transcript_11300/m.25977 type:complete len:87 (+) Transcript_11300:813-1073(+)